jgi:hypothetical protein
MMQPCRLCGTEFDARGLWAHMRKKQSCVSQKKVIYLYKQIELFLDSEEKKIDSDVFRNNIKDLVDHVEHAEPHNVIHNYGSEVINMTPELYTRIEKTNVESFKLFIKLFFCNPELPENQTLKMTSQQGTYCRTYKDGQWLLVCYRTVMIKLAKIFLDIFKGSEDDKMEDYMMFIHNVIRKDAAATKKFIAYTKKNVLPELYNCTKNRGENGFHKHKRKIEKK